ncbi:MAG: hypothetical protein II872_05015 [Clostridia bacterium]|nr:hypothetical protein [Clostridia bacterium]
MKKLAAVLLALVCLLSSGCHNRVDPETAPTPEPSYLDAILGEWEFHSILIGRQLFDPAAFGIDSTLSFYPNGAGVFKAQRGDDVKESVFRYTVSGSEITMLDEENETQIVTYDPETDTLCMEEENMSIVLVRKTAEPDPTPEPEPTPESDWTKAALEYETTEKGAGMVLITARIPAGATLRIVLPHQDDYTWTNDADKTVPRKVKIPVECFFPQTPLDEEMLTLTPEITLTTADGAEHAVECPPFSVEVPKLLLAIDSSGEATEDGFIAKADETGVYHLYGMLLTSGTEPSDAGPVEAGVTLTVNGTEIPVYAGGIFATDLPLVDGAPTTYVFVAEKNNYLTVEVAVTVVPNVSDT